MKLKICMACLILTFLTATGCSLTNEYRANSAKPSVQINQTTVSIAGDCLGAKTMYKPTNGCPSYCTVYYVPIYAETNHGSYYTYAMINEGCYLNYKADNAYSWSRTPLVLDQKSISLFSDTAIYEMFTKWAEQEGIETGSLMSEDSGMILFYVGIEKELW